MGTDVHVTAQKRVNGEWVDVPTVFMDDRNYAAFGWLANVRNYAGVPQLAPRRGLPGDAGEAARDLHEDNHSRTWYAVSELTSFDYDQPVENRRVMRQTATNVWNGGCTAEPCGGEMTTYRELFGEYFMRGIEKLKADGVDRIIISFDS
jgi:hypothetical protein